MGPGVDTLNGGDGGDTFTLSHFSDLNTGGVINGGAGLNDRILIAGSGGVILPVGRATLTGVEIPAYGTGGAAALAGAQLGTGVDQINQVIGSADANRLDVKGALIDLSQVSFAAWPAADEIHLFGTAGSDALTGSHFGESIKGNGGVDTVRGGGGNGTIDAVSGGDSVRNGGSGSGDVLLITGNAELSLATVSNFEVLQFGEPGNLTASLKSQQIGVASGLVHLIGDSFNNIVQVSGATVDLSPLDFQNWSTGSRIEVTGTGAGNALTGSGERDSLDGLGGNDTLTGGGGQDSLTDGAAKDHFTFTAVTDSTLAQSDSILDFTQGADIMDLSGIDANSATLADDRFKLVGTSAFSHHAGQLRFELSGGSSILISGDVDGDGAADFAIRLAGTVILMTPTDFIL